MSFPTAPLKSVTTLNPDTLGENVDPSQVFSYAEISDVSLGAGIRWQAPTPFDSLPSRARRLVRNDDVVVSTVRTYLRAVARVTSAPERPVVSTGFAVFRPTTIEPRYLGYALQETHFVDTIVAGSVGVSYPATNASDVARLRVSAPPHDAQRQIADYLDHETAEIDAFIADLERTRAISETHWRTSRDEILSGGPEAVADERLWLGRVHPSWRIGALKHLFTITLGKMLDEKRQRTEPTYPYVRAGNIGDGVLSLEQLNAMPFDERERQKYDLRAGDVLVVEGGSVGTNVVLAEGLDGVYFQKTVNRLRPRGQVSPRFYSEVLNAYRDAGVFDVIGNRSTIMHLTAEKLEALRVPVPDYAEQHRIANQLREMRLRLQEAITDIDAAIALAKERRAALITAAVTGQIDVTTKQTPAVDSIQTVIEES